jgi:DNA polymerase-4
MRRIMHVDMDAFFAAIEVRRRPELAGRPVIVGGSGDPTARGVVATASYEARKFGVRSAMPLRTAYRRCPQAVFLRVDFPTYAAVAEQVKSVLHEITPLVEDAGLDEAFLDISADARSGEELARLVKARLREATGLGCSIGIGPNKLLAKIASDMQKPDGLTILAEADIESLVWPLPVRRLWGVGPKTDAKLAQAGIGTIGELARAPLGWLTETFGEARGRYLSAAAHGIDESPLVTHWEPKSLGRETTFQRDVGDARRLAQTLARFAAELSEELREQRHVGRRVTVKLRYADFDTHTHGVALAHATDDPDVIREAALTALHRFGLAKKVRLIGLRVGGLAASKDPVCV